MLKAGRSRFFLYPILAASLITFVACGQTVLADRGAPYEFGCRLAGMKREALLQKHGGNEASEAAVEKALKWLVQHQLPDGSWSFDHTGGECKGRCSGKGTLAKARNGATAFVLLSLLGAGHTHKDGDYQKNVKAGLAFLVAQQKENGSLVESGGTMYSHAIAATCLCEAHGMYSGKGGFKEPAQKAIDFIVASQDPVGGGWRYAPKQPGDTSVTAWQVAPLTRGHLLKSPPKTFVGINKFFDSVETDGGVFYGYTTPGRGPGTTAMGLLSRVSLGGFRHDNASLKSGVNFLSKRGPSKTDSYYNLWATQLMFHYGGEPWKKWNAILRDHLIASQETAGHATGSWPPDKGHAAASGGRVLATAASAMTLETYYRHTRIFEDE